jgi:hypothetical protein
MTKAEEIHFKKMLETYRQYLLTDSWKRKKDLKKSLASLEKDWFDYQRFKNGGTKDGH